MRKPSVGLRVRRLQLRLAERALDRPFTTAASLRLDRRLLELERALRRESPRARRRAA
jgi:hypothetical protein